MRVLDEALSESELSKFETAFDHLSPTYARNPFDIYQHLRANKPMAWSDNHGGFWIPSRRDDIAEVARNDQLFTSTFGPSIPHFPVPVHPIDFDPPKSTEWRAFLMPLLTPARIAKMESIIRATAAELVDKFIERGDADLTTELARPLTTLTTFKLLGLDEKNAARVSDIVHRGIVGEIEPIDYMEGNAWIKETVMNEIAALRKQPNDGAVSYLIHNVKSEGQPLTDEEIYGTVNLFFAGGIDTTQATLSVAWYFLNDNPEIKQLLIDKPESRALALEEFFRFISPQQTLARRATTDCVIGGQQIKAGDQVLLPWAAGNWDESVFEYPERFIVDRSPNPHMTFGVGVHRCLGSNVARTMFHACMDEVLARLPDFKVDKSNTRRGTSCGIVYAYTHLPVTFTPKIA